MMIDELITREHIRDLLARYTYNGDRGRVAELAACFAPDGILEFLGITTAGPHAIQAVLTSGTRTPAIGFVRHHITNPLIDVAGDNQTASARSYFQVISNRGPDHAGTYSDKLTLTSEGWRFAHRLVRIDWQAEASLFIPMASR